MKELVLDSLSKSYGPTTALVDFSLTVTAGDVVALVGENGAGKSTLAKVLAGVEMPDQGRILMDGRPLHLSSPRDAMRHGISIIPQELAPVPTLSLAENMFLGDLPAAQGVVRQDRLRKAALQQFAQLGFGDLDVSQRADMASLPELQLVEIAKAVRRQSSVIVFDEPTASLSEAEAGKLHKIIVRLSERGVGIIYVSHRMDEIFTFSRRVCVLRNGMKVAEHETATVARKTIVMEMVGHEVESSTADGSSNAAAREILTLTHCSRREKPALADASLTLHAGEIVGLYGLRGSSADALAAVIGGQIKPDSGKFWVDGSKVPLPRSPRNAKKLGIGYIPADRKTEGLALRLSIENNIAFPNLGLVSWAGITLARRVRPLVRELVQILQIRLHRPGQRVEELSGGNQQKVLLGGRLAQSLPILVLQEPTRGVDVGARADIHRTLRSLTREEKGIIICSTDVEEVISVADRVIIVRGGSVVAELSGSTKTQEAAVAAAALTDAANEQNVPLTPAERRRE